MGFLLHLQQRVQEPFVGFFAQGFDPFASLFYGDLSIHVDFEIGGFLSRFSEGFFEGDLFGFGQGVADVLVVDLYVGFGIKSGVVVQQGLLCEILESVRIGLGVVVTKSVEKRFFLPLFLFDSKPCEVEYRVYRVDEAAAVEILHASESGVDVFVDFEKVEKGFDLQGEVALAETLVVGAFFLVLCSSVQLCFVRFDKL